MAKRKKQNSYGKKAFYIIIALIALFIIGFEAYRMVSSYIIKRPLINNGHSMTSLLGSTLALMMVSTSHVIKAEFIGMNWAK